MSEDLSYTEHKINSGVKGSPDLEYIDSEEWVQWYMKVKTAKEAELKTLKKQYEAMKKELESSLKSFEYLYQPTFEDHAKRILNRVEETTGKKTWHSLGGTIRSRKVKAKIAIEHSDFIPQRFFKEETIFKADIDALKEAVLVDGESFEGITAIPEGESISFSR